MNIGIAVISVTAQQSYGPIGITKDKAETNVKKFVKDELVKKTRLVNEEHIIPEGVGIDCKCSSCGQLQPWKDANAFPGLRLIGGIILGICMAVLLFPLFDKVETFVDFDGYLTILLLFITVILGIWGVDSGVKKIQQKIIIKKMSAFGGDYFPKLIDLPVNREKIIYKFVL